MNIIKKIGGFAEPCKTCRWVQDGGYCGNGDSKNFDMSKSDGVIGESCADWETRTPEQMQEEAGLMLAENVQLMGKYIMQMGQLLGSMQKRLDDLEARQAKVTISHGDVKKLQAKIRWRADAICGKYGLRDPESARKFRAAIKKDVLARYQVKDLHDLPAAMLPAAHKQIESWTDIRLVMERRVST